jgi:hypothetical protein
MPFPWYHPDVPPELTARPERAQQMYILELKERAALLMRLGYDKAEAAARLRGNVRWDFELHDVPKHLTRVEEVVEKVYQARGPGAGGPPSLEG